MKIGIYGGTFNPPHLGHMEAARAAIAELGLDRLIFIPDQLPPHKELPENSATAQQRFDMTAIMADGLLLPDVAEVSNMELQRPGKSYTIETLRQMKERYPQDELWLLMGTDMFFSLPHWYLPEEILRLASIAPFSRMESDSTEQMQEQSKLLQDRYGAHIHIVPMPNLFEISSAQVRSQGTGEGLWPAVWGYVIQHQLYGVDRKLNALDDADLRAVSYSMIRAKRIAHVQGTEGEAVRLAQRWGANEEYARRAAILHDCTKYWTAEEHLALCDQYGVALDDMERSAVKLMHAKSGAVMAEYVFEEPMEVVQAICWHTTAKANMSLLEKILYIADYMEPTRCFDGVGRLRSLAYSNLDAAVQLGTEMSVAEMTERGNAIHPNTLAARDYLKEIHLC